jgi:hypothetical protein
MARISRTEGVFLQVVREPHEFDAFLSIAAAPVYRLGWKNSKGLKLGQIETFCPNFWTRWKLCAVQNIARRLRVMESDLL